ncbi:uncharacterized protein JCM10292_001632 [Rhodotorula paludigena]|uniref:uncharacterized protein n=1 Tax=Rhodotorula paludigena TaxID=86838 RepID=UPI0031772361
MSNWTGGELSRHRKAKKSALRDAPSAHPYGYKSARSPFIAPRRGPVTTRPLIARSKKNETSKPSFDFSFFREEQAKAITRGVGLTAPVSSFYNADKPLTPFDVASETATDEVSDRPNMGPDPLLRGSSVIAPDTPPFSFTIFSSALPGSTPPPSPSDNLSELTAFDAASVQPCAPSSSSHFSLVANSPASRLSAKGLLERAPALPHGTVWSKSPELESLAAESRFHTETRSPTLAQTPGEAEADDVAQFDDFLRRMDQTSEPLSKPDDAHISVEEMLPLSQPTNDARLSPAPQQYLACDTPQYGTETLEPASGREDQPDPLGDPFDLPKSSESSHASPPSPAALPRPSTSGVPTRAADATTPSVCPSPYLGSLAASLSLPLPLTDGTGPVTATSQHLFHLRSSPTHHLADSPGVPPDAWSAQGPLLAHERLGLGCVALSPLQACQLLEREALIRTLGEECVPWWMSGEADEEEEQDDAASSVASEDLELNALLCGTWKKLPGMLFEPDDMTGVLEP